jgi:hypothetical protein
MANHAADGPRAPREYRPDIRPLLILGVLLLLVVLGWIALSDRILPAALPNAGDVDRPLGTYTRTPDAPGATTLRLEADTYRLEGDLPHVGGGTLTHADGELTFAADPGCDGLVGRYGATLGSRDRPGLLPENVAETLQLVLVEDGCASRAQTLEGEWVLRLSGRPDVYGICDPPNEEAAITGHWPEPSGC